MFVYGEDGRTIYYLFDVPDPPIPVPRVVVGRDAGDDTPVGRTGVVRTSPLSAAIKPSLITWVRGNRRVLLEQRCLKSSKGKDQTIAPPYPSVTNH